MGAIIAFERVTDESSREACRNLTEAETCGHLFDRSGPTLFIVNHLDDDYSLIRNPRMRIVSLSSATSPSRDSNRLFQAKTFQKMTSHLKPLKIEFVSSGNLKYSLRNAFKGAYMFEAIEKRFQHETVKLT